MTLTTPRPASKSARQARDAQLTAGAMELVFAVIAKLDYLAQGHAYSDHGNPALDACDLLAETLPVLELVAAQLRRD